MKTRLQRCALALTGAGLLGACVELDAGSLDEGGSEGEAVFAEGELVALDAWALVPAALDPLADHRPDAIVCPPGAWGPEIGGLEVQTGVCNYLALSQATRRTIAAGERVEIDLWHDTLDAAEPALGHFAVVLEGELIAEYEVEIPSAPALVELRWVAAEELPAGEEIGLHLHNHGYNAWTIVRVAVAEADPA